MLRGGEHLLMEDNHHNDNDDDDDDNGDDDEYDKEFKKVHFGEPFRKNCIAVLIFRVVGGHPVP